MNTLIRVGNYWFNKDRVLDIEFARDNGVPSARIRFENGTSHTLDSRNDVQTLSEILQHHEAQPVAYSLED